MILKLALVASLALISSVLGQTLSNQQQQQQPVEVLPENYPYYVQQSTLINRNNNQVQEPRVNQRSFNAGLDVVAPISSKPKDFVIPTVQAQALPAIQGAAQTVSYEPTATTGTTNSAACLYDRRYFARFDQCLEKKPYPTIGLPAFRNDDLLAPRNGLADKHGCSFLLTNGLFKHYQLAKYSIDADTNCLDDNKILQMYLQFNNVTLYYLWQLRCLNQANQLLDDGTLDGRSSTVEHDDGGRHETSGGANSICVGSSQNFGYSSMQLSNVDAQVELAIDIYKNWRITNLNLAMLPSSWVPAKVDESEQHSHEPTKSTGIRDFTFETLDGDELNWRYLNLYENWTRNKLHSNFLEQFKRFVWISLQRCLSESSDKLPVKLIELFSQQEYN